MARESVQKGDPARLFPHAMEADMGEKTVYDWGQSQALAPSIKRVDPRGWACVSLVAGLALALASLAISWRPWLGSALPPAALSVHLPYWAKLAAHALFKFAFADDARFYMNAYRSWSDAERVGMAWRFGLAFLCFCMPWALLARSYLSPRDALIHLRGSIRLSGVEAVSALKAVLQRRVKRRPDHEIAPGVAYPADLWTRHVLVVGGTGAGKSTAIKPLIDRVVASGEQMLLFDPKSEFTEGFGKPAIIAPWDSRSLSWDVARDMRNPLDMRRFAATVISESQDPMWSNASRQLLVGLMIYLRATRGHDWGWLELKELISQPQARLLSIMKDWHPEAVRSVEKASVTTAGILINLSSFCSSIFDLAEAWGDVPRSRRVSFVEWAQGKSKFPQIILQGHGAYAELTKSYVEGIVGVFSAMVNSVEMRDDPKRKIWFIADEFVQMGKIPVRPLFEVGRSRGVRCVIACQDFAQIEELYGAPMVKALVGMCGSMLVGQIMQGETAEQICKAFGAREVERANVSASSGGAGSGPGRSTTLSFNRDEVPLYKPSELSSRLGLTPDGEGIVMILFTGGQAYELRWPHYKIRSEREPYMPAPWTVGESLGGIPEQSQRAREAEAKLMQPSSGVFAEPLLDKLFKGAGVLLTGNPVDEVSEVSADGADSQGHENTEPESEVRTASGLDPSKLAGTPMASLLRAESLKSIAASELDMPEGQKTHIEVRAAPTNVASTHEPDGAEPLFDAILDMSMHKSSLEALSVALSLVGVGAASQPDANPGPRQEVALAASPPKDRPDASPVARSPNR